MFWSFAINLTCASINFEHSQVVVYLEVRRLKIQYIHNTHTCIYTRTHAWTRAYTYIHICTHHIIPKKQIIIENFKKNDKGGRRERPKLFFNKKEDEIEEDRENKWKRRKGERYPRKILKNESGWRVKVALLDSW